MRRHFLWFETVNILTRLDSVRRFDWTTGQTTATSEPTSTKSAHTPSKAKPPSQAKVAPTATEGASPAASASSVAPPAPLDPEEEAKRRRAERFGITYIPPKPKDVTKPKPAATKKDTPATMKPQATNGKASVGAKPSEVRSLDICHQHSLTSHALGCGEVKRTRRAVWHLDEVKTDDRRRVAGPKT